MISQSLKNVLKKIIVSFATLYTYNLFAVPFNMIIGINIINIIIVLVGGFPGIVGIVLFRFII